MAATRSIAEYLGRDALNTLGARISSVMPNFPLRTFVQRASADVYGKSLFVRANVVADLLRTYLECDVPSSLRVLVSALPPPRAAEGYGPLENFMWLPCSRYVSRHAIDYVGPSLDALRELTRRFTSEFDLRAFLERYPEEVYEEVRVWCNNPDLHVRRLAVEGTRPRLPWVRRLDQTKFPLDRSLVLLNHLRDDPSRYVRRSVANHVADLIKGDSKDIYPMLWQWAESGDLKRRWVIRHAIRYPVSKGVSEARRLMVAVSSG